jgi:hypothetical protein
MDTIKHKELVEPTKENLIMVLGKINQYVLDKGYRIEGELKLPSTIFATKAPIFKSVSQKKLVRSYCTRLCTHMTMSQVNKFLHLLFKHVYKEAGAPRIEYSEQECKIKAARKAWKELDTKAKLLLKEYKTVKGNFYKKK